jgi:hypothetical protein
MYGEVIADRESASVRDRDQVGEEKQMERPASTISPGNRTRTSTRRATVRIGLASILFLAAGPALSQPHNPVAILPVDLARPLGMPQADVIRFLEQSTFGPTPALIAHVQSVGFEAYLQEQFAAPASTYPSLPEQPDNASLGCPAGSPATCLRDNYSMYPLQVQFFKNALSGEDQLRQRVALALHEMLVVSGVKVRQPSEVSPYLNMLQQDAFANYRQILYDLTLNPAMGHYLDMVNNDAPVAGRNVSPNENYAREVLQLFSIGVNQLNPDGTVVLDTNGNPVPTYVQDTIEDFAHVFTGWTYAPLNGASLFKHDPSNFLSPMVLYRNNAGQDTNHDKGLKLLLTYPGSVDSTLPANQDGAVDLAQALDNIFHHPNVGPFIGKQLIQHLVTSNPSPSYVSRVAAAFDDNGAGVRGDLKAVVRAILMDTEARGMLKTDPGYGHLREPVLFITGLLRALGATTDGELAGQANAMGQNLFNSPSVFSYYPHEYLVPGTTVQGPEFGIQSSSTAEARLNFVNALTSTGVKTNDGVTTVDLTFLQQLAGSPPLLVGQLNTFLLHGTMSSAMQAAVTDAVTAVPSTNPTLRVQTAVYLVAGSSQYQVER